MKFGTLQKFLIKQALIQFRSRGSEPLSHLKRPRSTHTLAFPFLIVIRLEKFISASQQRTKYTILIEKRQVAGRIVNSKRFQFKLATLVWIDMRRPTN